MSYLIQLRSFVRVFQTGSITAIAPALPPLLREGVDIRLQVGNREFIYQLLSSRDADIGIIASKPEVGTHGFEEIYSERLVLVAPPEISYQLKVEFSAVQLLRSPVAYVCDYLVGLAHKGKLFSPEL